MLLQLLVAAYIISNNKDTNIKTDQKQLTALVRYGKTQQRGYCIVEDNSVKQHNKCLIETKRGYEIGVILTVPTITEQQEKIVGTVFHQLQQQEQQQAQSIEENVVSRIKTYCKEQIRKLRLEIKLIDIEYSLNGQQLLVMYEARERIDFRTLVQRLAKKYKTRIEMRQIKPRISAKVLGDIGVCGQELCCKRFLDGLPPVNVGMAEKQGIPKGDHRLGRCGELKCCLRYENGQYKQGKCTHECDPNDPNCGKNAQGRTSGYLV